MREVVFALDYEPGWNAVADTLAAHSDARIRSLSLHATETSLWRVDHATGPGDALDAVEETFLTADYYADCLATADCGATQTTQVLDHSADALVLYSYWERTPTCTSVPHLALDHLGDGVLFETRHRERRYTWRVIHSGEGDVRGFLDAIDDAVGEAGEVEMRSVTDVSTPAVRDADGRLSPEQDEAVRTAVERGYYETPRAVDVGDLADHLDVPRSTLTYRLRRAESQLANRYVQRDAPAEVQPGEL